MANDYRGEGAAREAGGTVSVVGPGMEVVGEVKCDGTIRIEGRVEGSIDASKSVVIGREGNVAGDITTREIVVAGSVAGTITGEARVELQDTCQIEGNVHSPCIKLDEGGKVDGRLHMGHMSGGSRSANAPKAATSSDTEEKSDAEEK